MTPVMVEVSSVVGSDVTGDGTRERPFATLGRARQVAELIEAVEGQRPVISYDGMLGSFVPQERPDGSPLVGVANLLGLVLAGWLMVACLVGLGVLVWHHPGVLVFLVCAAVVLLAAFGRRGDTGDQELDEIDQGAL